MFFACKNGYPLLLRHMWRAYASHVDELRLHVQCMHNTRGTDTKINGSSTQNLPSEGFALPNKFIVVGYRPRPPFQKKDIQNSSRSRRIQRALSLVTRSESAVWPWTMCLRASVSLSSTSTFRSTKSGTAAARKYCVKCF